MKRILSLLLCVVMISSVFTATTGQVYAAGSVESLFEVKSTDYSDSSITYTISLAAGIEKLQGVIIKAKYDSTLLEVDEKSGAAGKVNSYKELVENVPGVYEDGVVYNDAGAYSFAYIHPTGYNTGDSAKEFLEVTFNHVGDKYPAAEVEFVCSEFVTADGIVVEKNSDQSFFTDSFQTLNKAYSKEVLTAGDGLLQFSWTEAKGADYYDVYRKAEGGKLECVAQVPGTQTSFIDSVAQSTIYYYTVASRNEYYTHDYDTNMVKGMCLGTIKDISATLYETGVEITWEGIDILESYGVFRKTADSDWEEIATLTECEYVDEDVESGTEYFYTIKGYYEDYIAGSLQEPVSVIYIESPSYYDHDVTEDAILLNWSLVDGAHGYRVYRKAPADTQYVFVCETDNLTNEYEDKAVVNGEAYSYKVTSFMNDTESIMPSEGYSAKKFPMAGNVRVELADDGILIKWDAVEGVDSYNVYRTVESGSLRCVAIALKPEVDSFVDTSAKVGKVYTYSVVTVCDGVNSAKSVESESICYTEGPVLTDAQVDDDGIYINWEEVSYAVSYNVYRKTADGEYSFLANTTELFYEDYNVEEGETYFYKVSSVNECNEGAMSSDYFELTKISAPKNIASEICSESIKLTWDKVMGAEGYTVYRKAAGESTFKVVAENVEANEYSDTAVESGAYYSYMVSASAKGLESTLSDETDVVKFISAPAMSAPMLTSEAVVLSWNGVKGAAYYEIYRKAEGESDYTYLTKTSELTYSDKEVEGGVLYAYTVRTVIDDDNKSVLDPVGCRVIKLADVENIVAEMGSTYITVSWDAVDRAEGYTVYRKADNGEWTVVSDKISETQYIDRDVETGVVYSYAVSPYVFECVQEKNHTSNLISFMASPTISSVAIDKASIVLQWNDIAGAKSYNIYRTSANGTELVLYKNVDDSVYTDTDVDNGADYIYSITSVGSNGESVLDTQGKRITKLPVTEITDVQLLPDGLEIKWNQVEGIESYLLYRTPENGKTELVKELPAGTGTYLDKDGLVSGTAYSYSIATKGYGYETLVSALSDSVYYLESPADIKVQVLNLGVEITYTGAKNAQGYVIYRKTANGEFEKLIEVTGNTYRYTDKTVASGEDYVYGVSAKSGNTETDIVEGSLVSFVSAPVVTYSEKYNCLKLSWKKCEGAEKYVIYDRNRASVIAVCDGDATSYSHKAVKSCQWNYYTVVAVRGETENSNRESRYYYIGGPVVKSLENRYGYVRIEWSEIEDAEKYVVYRRKAGTSSWSKLGSTTKLAYADKTAKSNTTYEYTVKAVVDDDDYKSPYNTSGWKIKCLSAPKLSSAKNAYGYVKISWEKVSGASKYVVYRKSGSGSWKKLGSTTSTSYKDKTAASGKKYTYTVKSYQTGGLYSSFDSTGKSVTYVEAPDDVKLSNTSKGVKLKWGKVSGATKYVVYRKSGSGSWSKLGTVTTNSYVDKTSKSGKTYKYMVKAYKGSAASSYKSSGWSIKCRK